MKKKFIKTAAGKTISALAAAAIVIVSAAAARTAVAGESYTFHVPIVESLSNSSMVNLLRDCGKVISDKLGVALNIKIDPYQRGEISMPLTEKAFNSKAPIFGVVYSEDYVRLQKKHSKSYFTPIATLTVMNSKSMNMCFYVKKGDKHSSVSDFKKKKIALTTTHSVRWLLHEKAGYDGSLYDYFSDVVFVPDSDVLSGVNEVIEGKVAAFVTNKGNFAMSNAGEKGNQVEPILCSEFAMYFIVSASPEVKPEMVQKVKSLLLNAHKDKAFDKFKFVFTAIKGHFMPVTDEDLKITKQVVQLSEKYKWDDDERKLKKVQVAKKSSSGGK